MYFGFEGKEVVVLVAGGNRRSQKRDIVRARRYWIDYLDRNQHGAKKY